MSLQLLRREVVLILTALVTLIMLIGYFVTIPVFKSAYSTINSLTVPVTAFFLVFGTISSLIHNSKIVIGKGRNWKYSVITVITTIVFFLYGAVFGVNNTLYQKAYTAIILQGNNILFAILAFWFIESAYYSYRIKNLEMLAFVIPSFIVMAASTPLISVYWQSAAVVKSWFMTNPMGSAYRGIIIAVAISTTLMAVRIILLRESGWMGGKE